MKQRAQSHGEASLEQVVELLRDILAQMSSIRESLDEIRDATCSADYESDPDRDVEEEDEDSDDDDDDRHIPNVRHIEPVPLD